MSPDRINTSRGFAIWAIRAVSAFFLALGAYLVLKRFVMAIITRDLDSAFFSWTETGEQHSLYRGIAMLITGAGLGLMAHRIARWVLPVPPTGCPRCGYEKIEHDRCPECGLTGFAAPPD